MVMNGIGVIARVSSKQRKITGANGWGWLLGNKTIPQPSMNEQIETASTYGVKVMDRLSAIGTTRLFETMKLNRQAR